MKLSGLPVHAAQALWQLTFILAGTRIPLAAARFGRDVFVAALLGMLCWTGWSLAFTGMSFAAEAAEKPKIELFGKMEFKGSFKNLPAWIRVIEEAPKRSIFKDDSKLNTKTTWGQLRSELEKLSPKEQLVRVNRFWNSWPYREDMAVYKVPDYWAIPEEFAKNSGDCEDYSIAKYYTLRELGFDPDDMRIAIVKETVRNIAHAVLVVYLDGDAFVLDNLSNSVLSHKVLRNYDIQFSVNEKFRWAHIKKK